MIIYCAIESYVLKSVLWRDAREAEGARLEIVYSANNGIEGSTPSLSAMHHVRCMACPKPDMVYGAVGYRLNLILLIVGSCATNGYKPRQVRKEAAVVSLFVCRRGAWLSTSY